MKHSALAGMALASCFLAVLPSAPARASGPDSAQPDPDRSQPDPDGAQDETPATTVDTSVATSPSPAPSPTVDTPAPAPGPPVFDIPRRRGVSWDLEIEGGVRLARSEELGASTLMGRLKLGVMLVREPLYLSLMATGELGGVASRGIGAQLQLTHVWSGLWGHLGGTWSRDDTAVLSAAVGWALLGLEWQRELTASDSLGDALFLELRLPLGIIYVLQTRKPTLQVVRPVAPGP